jgi:hypothetical protein
MIKQYNEKELNESKAKLMRAIERETDIRIINKILELIDSYVELD